MEEEKKEEWTKGDIIGVTIFSTLVVTGVLMLVVGFFTTNNSRYAEEFRAYRNAVEFCGKENTNRHRYTDGSTDFTCEDYSQI